MGSYIFPSNPSNSFSGGTVSGYTSFDEGLNANSLSANTIFSGSTNLYNIFLPYQLSGSSSTFIQDGINTFTGGTANLPTINITSAVLNNLSTSGTNTAFEFSATTISGGTIFSGNTDLYSIFLTQNDGNDITRVQEGTNTFTGGTANLPTINLVDSPSFNNILFSGNVIGGNVISNSVSANTIYSAGTDLYSIFLTQNDGNDITRVQEGTNTFTGGTSNFPTINITSATLNNLSTSGTNTATQFFATTLSGGTLYSGSTDLNIYFRQDRLALNTKANLSGATFTGNVSIPILSTSTIYSAGTDLYSIFLTQNDGNDITRVQSGVNTFTGGTNNLPTINITSATLNNLSTSGTNTAFQFSATTISGGTIFSGSTDLNSSFSQIKLALNTKANLSGATFTGTINTSVLSGTNLYGGIIYSAGTDLYSIFLTQNDGNDITRVQGGMNIFTGGTANLPTVNISSATLNNLSTSGTNVSTQFSATTISGGTITSGSTNLYSIFAPIGSAGVVSTYVQNGINTFTGGTSNLPTVNITSATLNNLSISGTNTAFQFSSTTLSGGTITSGSTNLYSIFAPIGSSGGTSTYVQNGINTFTGGTSNLPTVNIYSATLNNLSTSGTNTAFQFSATTISGGTIYSGSTDLNISFSQVRLGLNTKSNLSGTTFTGTINAPSISGGTLSGGTIFSGSTDLYNIFITQNDGNDITRIQNGTNTFTGGTNNLPTVNITSAVLNNLSTSGTNTAFQFSATTISGGTLYSGSTDLNVYFNQDRLSLNTKANLSGATFTGTINAPSISGGTISGGTITSGSTNLYSIFAPIIHTHSQYATLSGSTFTGTVNATSLSATTLTGGIITSGATNLYSIFAAIGSGGGISTYVQNGTNIFTGGTNNLPTVNITSATLNNLSTSGTNTAVQFSSTTLSGGTIYSGSTDLSLLFAPFGSIAGSSTYVQNGINTFTGGTNNLPTLNITSATLNNISTSGTNTAVQFSSTTLSGGTLYSGATNLYSIFALNGATGIQAFTGTTNVNFGNIFNSESDFATTAVTNSNITSNSSIIFKIITSSDHSESEDSLLEGITLKESDILDGVGFNINAYAINGTWGIYNIFYKIIN